MNWTAWFAKTVNKTNTGNTLKPSHVATQTTQPATRIRAYRLWWLACAGIMMPGVSVSLTNESQNKIISCPMSSISGSAFVTQNQYSSSSCQGGLPGSTDVNSCQSGNGTWNGGGEGSLSVGASYVDPDSSSSVNLDVGDQWRNQSGVWFSESSNLPVLTTQFLTLCTGIPESNITIDTQQGADTEAGFAGQAFFGFRYTVQGVGAGADGTYEVSTEKQDSFPSMPVVEVVPSATLTPLLGLINADATTPQTLSFTLNNTSTEAITPAISVTGRDSGVLPLSDISGCTSLAADSTCTIEVTYNGSDHEVLGALVVNTASGDLLATALLASKEATVHEAARRLPDVLSSVTLPASFKNGVQTNDIEWSTLSYQSSVYSQIAVFECTQAALDDKTCGSDIVDASPAPKTSLVMPAESVSVPTPAWMYKDVAAKQYNFKHSFTPNCPNGESIVLRFYQKSGEDNEANYDTLSLLIPGGSLFENYYYDTVGRRLMVPCEL